MWEHNLPKTCRLQCWLFSYWSFHNYSALCEGLKGSNMKTCTQTFSVWKVLWKPLLWSFIHTCTNLHPPRLLVFDFCPIHWKCPVLISLKTPEIPHQQCSNNCLQCKYKTTKLHMPITPQHYVIFSARPCSMREHKHLSYNPGFLLLASTLLWLTEIFRKTFCFEGQTWASESGNFRAGYMEVFFQKMHKTQEGPDDLCEKGLTHVMRKKWSTFKKKLNLLWSTTSN